jgi:hypothetical protein
MGILSKILLFTLIGVAPSFATVGRLPPSTKSCDEITDHVLRDLRKLDMDNDQVRSRCEANAGIPANEDHSNRWSKGDCQLTYNTVRYYTKGVGKELNRACRHVQEARQLSEACTRSGQADCQTRTGAKFAEAGTALRSSLNLMKRARENLQERMIWNAETAEQYADYLMRLANALQNNQPPPDPSPIYGPMTPEQVIAAKGLTNDPNRLRQAASSITNTFKTIGGDVTGLDRYSREQASAFRHGENFLKEGRQLEAKIQRFSAYVNKNATTQIDRGQQLGAGPNSSITGGASDQLAGAQQLAAAKQLVAAQQMAAGGSGAGAGYPSAVQAGSNAGSISARSQPLEPDLEDEELHSTLEGKPLSAAELERREAPAEAAVLAEEAKSGQDSAPGLFGSGAAGEVAGVGSDSLAPVGAESPRGLASVAEKSPGSPGEQNLTGASSPGSRGKAAVANPKEGNEALANYAAASGGAKLLDRGGPSLRDMLRQKMQGGGASTRAMHEVLGSISELGGPAEKRPLEASGPVELGSAEDIKGIDSEPLFVRVRAAHLRYQRVHVSDTSI